MESNWELYRENPDATGKRRFRNVNLERYDTESSRIVVTMEDANVVCSDTDDEDVHYPVIDLDVPAKLIPSSTPGHSHLYLDVAMTEAQFVYLLDVLAEIGVVEPGYTNAAKDRRYASVRLPWVKKDSGESSTD